MPDQQEFNETAFWQEVKNLLEGSVFDPQVGVLKEGVLSYFLIDAPAEAQPDPPARDYSVLATFSPKERSRENRCWPDERWLVLISDDGITYSALTQRRGYCWIKNLPPGQYTASLLTPVEYRERYGEPNAQETPDDPETEEIVAGLRQLLNPETESRRRRKPLGHWPLG